MLDIREYMDLKFGMFADKVSDLTTQVGELAQAVIKITTLEERQKTSDVAVDKRLSDLEGRLFKVEGAHTDLLIESARNRIYYIAGNFIATSAATALMAFVVKKIFT